MHDHGGQHHAGTDHPSDGQVRSAKKDQAADAQRQEHPGRSRLQDIQDVVHGQQLCMLDNGRQNAQQDKDKQNRDIEAVLQQELLDIERIPVIFKLLFLSFRKSEF